jgi:hypothetical protein
VSTRAGLDIGQCVFDVPRQRAGVDRRHDRLPVDEVVQAHAEEVGERDELLKAWSRVAPGVLGESGRGDAHGVEDGLPISAISASLDQTVKNFLQLDFPVGHLISRGPTRHLRR